MSWRTLVIQGKAKISYKNDYLIIRKDELKMVHLSEINTIIVDSTQVTVTTYLLSELAKKKIKIVFCDEKRLPFGEVVPYYGSHNTSKKVAKQFTWLDENKRMVWTEVVKQKILNQSSFLKKIGSDNYPKLNGYAEELLINDSTNREGHAAKVYFNSLFGKGFTRDDENDINAALNYGYTIILSNFTKEIVSNGYVTQIGIRHKNEFNHFNLSSDLMEPFRTIVDELVYENRDAEFNGEYKLKLVDMLNKQINISGRNQYLTNAISIYVRSIFEAIENGDNNLILHFRMI